METWNLTVVPRKFAPTQLRREITARMVVAQRLVGTRAAVKMNSSFLRSTRTTYKFVPSTETFNHAADAELNFTEPGLGTALQCGPPMRQIR